MTAPNTLVNASTARLVEESLLCGEGQLSQNGALSVDTGKYTGRSPKDKFIVKEPSSEKQIDWSANQAFSEEDFDLLYAKVLTYLKDVPRRYIFRGFAGSDPASRLAIQVVNERAWHNLFAQLLFIQSEEADLDCFQDPFTVLHAPGFKADPQTDGTSSEAFIIISFEKRLILIGGTEYAGEIKKSIFTVMNFLLPEQTILSMHCSANIGKAGDVALFFGLSGTGKTTLSNDPNRQLIGDDEHGWSDQGLFNIEGGCYAKTIHLSKQKEPIIWNAIRFGAVLENVALDEATRIPDYSDGSLTENTRAAYSLSHLENVFSHRLAPHPTTIIFLTADAFGVLPPISKLTKEQAIYHFLSGYTSKLAGTERGITLPEATFSTCFGQPFLPLSPTVYAEALGKKIEQFEADVYLINTGWTGGPYGVGSRINLAYTRSMIEAALSKALDQATWTEAPLFNLRIPLTCPNVPSHVLNPETAWSDSEAYLEAAHHLAQKFIANFKRFDDLPPEIEAAGPHLS
ncbi:phosphoenolpyruvate carboxykinase (ATP) [Pullulanibacillus sp. KACC 23026]|uniref:phosphoenolpyruvate carboxykinase (ATP) n=1 Tax=Pullulanibacillus sp. KACC 23026 TaxID=3028315 RepID=UPI0023B00944|nr:phosphoenolpyruvate carboxykinase (ATP) [Pullulanibacillus sp. KACC 23026]WEG14905.1 phosphoenolpyruvate carboxykinase (ATP) [Pullulanibacillus sp. KACC 23026]